MNKAERTAKYTHEHDLIHDAWMTLYNGQSEVDATLEAAHMAPGFRLVIDEIVEELICAASEKVNEVPLLEQADFVLNLMANAASIMSYRFYGIGQFLAKELPLSKMTPCGCQSLSDEDLEQLLSGPFELEGEGWVIKNFVYRKEVTP